MKTNTTRKTIRIMLIFFMTSLLLSGVTAIPIDIELDWLQPFLAKDSSFYQWIHKVFLAYTDTKSKYPFLMYGYDWLAFAHIILAILFIGPYRDPVKNIWVIEFGMISCLLVLPLAFIAGSMRGIPIGWQLIDCSFGIIGLIPLSIVYTLTHQLEQKNHIKTTSKPSYEPVH